VDTISFSFAVLKLDDTINVALPILRSRTRAGGESDTITEIVLDCSC